jgi:hypothetical protein
MIHLDAAVEDVRASADTSTLLVRILHVAEFAAGYTSQTPWGPLLADIAVQPNLGVMLDILDLVEEISGLETG